MFSSSSESSAETDNEQAQDNTRNATFSNKTSSSIWSVVGSAPSSGEAQHSVGSEGSALPLPAWLDASSQDSSAADARVQSIRDIIRVGKLIFVFFGYLAVIIYLLLSAFYILECVFKNPCFQLHSGYLLAW